MLTSFMNPSGRLFNRPAESPAQTADPYSHEQQLSGFRAACWKDFLMSFTKLAWIVSEHHLHMKKRKVSVQHQFCLTDMSD